MQKACFTVNNKKDAKKNSNDDPYEEDEFKQDDVQYEHQEEP